MSVKKFIALGAAASLFLGLPAFSETTPLSDLEAYHNAKYVITEPGKQFDKSHWAYQSLKDLSNKYGLLLGDGKSNFAGNQPLTRNEAAVILVNLIGKIEKEKVEPSEIEKNQLEIMKNEFSNEHTMLTGRIEKIEEEQSRTFKARIGENHQIAGVIQAQYTGNFFGKGLDSRASNFSLPLADVTLKGDLRPHLFYNINTYPSRNFTSSTNGLLGDVYIGTDIIPKHKIYFGQTRKPLGLEGSQSSYTLEVAERAQISRKLGDQKDMGVKVAGDLGLIDYYAGVYNGSGQNTNDTRNSDMEYAFTAAINPFHKNPEYGKLKLGGGYDYGKTTYSHNTYGYFGEYQLGKYFVRAEYAKKNGYNASHQYASGWYVHNSYFLTDKLQLIGRVDLFDENVNAGKNRLSEYTAGVNYYFDKHNLKLIGNFVYSHNKLGTDGKRLVVLSQYMF